MRLAPTELGGVQIGITRQPDGPARVVLLAERPDTLQLLMHDQPALHRALDLAGVPAEGRLLHFQLGTPDSGRDPMGAVPLQVPPSGLTGTHAGGGFGAGGNGQQSGSGSDPGGRGSAQGWSVPQDQPGLPGASLRSPPRPASASRPGVDITA